jgi:hypothetical protein
MIEQCPKCGFEGEKIEGPCDPYNASTPSCWKEYCDLMAMEFSDSDTFKFHRYTVDSYMVQHSTDYSRASVQSTWVHLAGLYVMLDINANPKFVGKVLGKITEVKREYSTLDYHGIRYNANVGSVKKHIITEGYAAAAKNWAEEVWKAWELYHQAIMDFTKPFLSKLS